MSSFLEQDDHRESDDDGHDEEEVHSYSCRMENIKLLIDLLSSLCLDLHKDQDCLIDVTEEGT